jgi:hypothetical protein
MLRRLTIKALDEEAHRHVANITITSTVTIRVTPKDDFLVSWAILWAGFVIASLVATWQVWKESRSLSTRRGQTEEEQATDGVSTADVARSIFRRLLLAAMASRIVLMPVQIWSTPVWWQFVGDTLPEMLFAAAWTLLVSFFVQLVGIATGTSTSTMPGIVIQGTAYVVYLLLITLQLWNSVASVLLYALLCCIYAALFGTVSYFCPRLLSILQPSLVQHGGLVTRISICTVLCISMFGAHTIGYARLVLAPPHRVFWWWNYGVLELLPSSIFLVIMNPSSNKSSEREHEDLSTDGSRKIGRTDSASSAMSHPTGNSRKQQETIALLKNSPVYGSSGKTTTT